MSDMFEDHIAVPLAPNRTHRGLSGSILRMKDGSLLFIHGIETDIDKCEGWLVARTSHDDGQTWGEPFSPLAMEENFEAISPSLLRLDNGEILFFYTIDVLSARPSGWSDFTRVLDQHEYVRRSSDEGQTWSAPICAAPLPGSCQAMPDKVMQLSSGRIILPVESPWPVARDHHVSLCFFSDDNGYAWLPSENIVDLGGNTEEPSVVELESGRLIMICRTRLGYLARAYSEDQALTWSKPELVHELPDPCAGFHAVRIPTTGDLLLIFCKNPMAPALCDGEKQTIVQVGELKIPLGGVRAPMTAAISKDDGQTWGNFRNITSDAQGVYGDYGYPGITWIENGKVALVNYHALDGIRLARIGVDWFYSASVGSF